MQVNKLQVFKNMLCEEHLASFNYLTVYNSKEISETKHNFEERWS